MRGDTHASSERQRTARFVALLILGLAALAVGGSYVLNSTMRTWSQKDTALRALLAVNGARRTLVTAWQAGHTPHLGDVLADIARDERIMGAAACSPSLDLVAATGEYPRAFPCDAVARLVDPQAAAQSDDWRQWTSLASLPAGSVHLSAIQLNAGETELGFVVLAHDMSFVSRRQATTGWFVLVGFAILGFAASALTIAAARVSWRGWNAGLRAFLRSGDGDPRFRPVLQDVRALVERLAAERDRDGEGEGGGWTAERLKRTLLRELHGERLIIVANREPYIHDRAPDGSIRVLHPASGLVTALEPVMRACSGVWVGHGSGSADRETSDSRSRVLVPPGEESYAIRRVWLTDEEERGYYYGFANEGLWPLCHIAHTRPTFRIDDWHHYQEVNRRFADAVCDEAVTDDPVVLVQDYHFALAPRYIRERLPRATIIGFWHIPWPNAERFGICPFREQILEGMLGCSIVGFHTPLHCNNFVEAVDRYLEARIDRDETAVVHGGHRTLVRGYPISIEWPSRWMDGIQSPATCRETVRAQLGIAPDTLVGVGIDRLDYTKGIEERLLTVERLLERFPVYRGKFTFVQLAAPSRTAIEQYRNLNTRVEEIARRINGRFSAGTYKPIVLLRSHHEPPDVFRFYRAADLCYVSSLHDGMNLVAKEFVSARDDDRGVLILSQFTGAARELTEALVVNPYDLEEASSAMAAALSMSESEQEDRMRAMRSLVREFNVYRWAGRMLVDAARLRRHERLLGRLSGPHGHGRGKEEADRDEEHSPRRQRHTGAIRVVERPSGFRLRRNPRADRGPT